METREANSAANVIQLAGPKKSNQEIMEGLLNRSPDAAAALYEQFGDLINRLVWRMLGADPDHDDVVHQVFINVISSIGSVKNPLALRSWIAGVTVNTIGKELRSRKYRRTVHFTEKPEMPDESMGPEKQLFVQRLYAIVSRMKAEERIMFVLRFIEGHRIAEISAVTGRSIATVKRKVAKAKKKFMKKARKDFVLSSMIEAMKDEQ